MPFARLPFLLGLAAFASLAACSEDTVPAAARVDGGAPPPPSAEGGASAPVATGFVYSAEPLPETSDAALTLFGAKGAAGAAYVGPIVLGSRQTALFVAPSPGATYTYAAEPVTSAQKTRDGYLATLNARGREGFAYKGAQAFGGSVDGTLFFVKNTAKSASYTYLGTEVATTEAAFTTELNARGREGYVYLGDIVANPVDLATRFSLYQREGAVTVSYTLRPLLEDKDALLGEIEQNGRNKAVWKGGYFVGSALYSLYETNASTAGQVSTRFENDPGAEGYLAALNRAGAEGFFFAGPYLVGTASLLVFCRGALTALPLLGTVLP